MCLICKRQPLKTATEDITCYKKVRRTKKENVFQSNYQYPPKKYTTGKLHKAKIEEKPFGIGSICCFDDRDSNHYFGKCGDGYLSRWTIAKRDNLMVIGPGLHSATTPERVGHPLFHTQVIALCIIPKGAKYLEDETGLLISNQLIVVAEVPTE